MLVAGIPLCAAPSATLQRGDENQDLLKFATILSRLLT